MQKHLKGFSFNCFIYREQKGIYISCFLSSQEHPRHYLPIRALMRGWPIPGSMQTSQPVPGTGFNLPASQLHPSRRAWIFPLHVSITGIEKTCRKWERAALYCTRFTLRSMKGELTDRGMVLGGTKTGRSLHSYSQTQSLYTIGKSICAPARPLKAILQHRQEWYMCHSL